MPAPTPKRATWCFGATTAICSAKKMRGRKLSRGTTRRAAISLLRAPVCREGAVCSKSVSLLDLYPTLIELLGLPNPPQALDGNSLVPLLKNADAEWERPVLMTSQMDGVFFESVLDNDYRMTRLITGETELYKLSSDPHEFTNLAENPEYAPVIEKLEKHLSFRYPEIPADGWIEAESIPAQTSADYKLRGNCHYPRSDASASGGRMICADLRAGKGSYIDFVLDVQTPGTYRLGGTIASGGACSVLVDDVKNDAAQSDTGYPMNSRRHTGGFRSCSKTFHWAWSGLRNPDSK